MAVVAEPGRAGFGELGHLGELCAVLAFRDRREKADWNLGLHPGGVGERSEHRSRVHDRFRIRHRQERAVAARRRSRGTARDRLLVLPPGRAEMDVWVDERRREHETLGVDHPVAVRRQTRPELGDRARVDADVQHRVEAFRSVDHARLADDEILLALLAEQHYAAPISCRAAAWTPTGPWVSRS